MTTKLNKLLLSKHNRYETVYPFDFANETELLNKVAELLNSGVDILELNTQNINSAEILSIATKVRELTAVFEALFIIYDRIDIAKLAEADGISLDTTTINIKNAQKLTEGTMLIGLYANSQQDITEAENNNVDFVISKNDINSAIIKTFTLNKQ